MATFKAYRQGATCGVGNNAPTGGQRGEVTGWTAGAVRRHTKWLYSINPDELDGQGDAVTLTLRDMPPTSDDWRRLVANFLDRLRRMDSITRWHWIVEWQRRGVPHLHLAVYSRTADKEQHGPGRAVADVWLELAAPYGAARAGQFVTPITGPTGWLQYLSKHAARGVRHYQRQGKPQGWDKTGRLWGKGGTWPVNDAVEGLVSQVQFHRMRRMVQGYAIASARSEALRYQRLGKTRKAAGAWRRVGYLRRMYKDSSRPRSTVRGFSEWVPAEVLLSMALLAGWQGEMKAAS